MSEILDGTGQPATSEIMDAAGAPIPSEPPPANVVPLPSQALERTAKIIQRNGGDRLAIAMLFETRLKGNRANLLLARMYVAAENAEREVLALGDKDVERIVKKFTEGQAGARPDGA